MGSRPVPTGSSVPLDKAALSLKWVEDLSLLFQLIGMRGFPRKWFLTGLEGHLGQALLSHRASTSDF